MTMVFCLYDPVFLATGHMIDAESVHPCLSCGPWHYKKVVGQTPEWIYPTVPIQGKYYL
jgi:hypothetical protein